MTTREEESDVINVFKQKNRSHSLVLYSCTSGYPVSFEDVYLLEIRRLKDLYSSSIKSVGFSGHHKGIAIDISAYTLGAEYIERHFTLDRTWKGTDHAASLEPAGMSKLVRDLSATHKAIDNKTSDIVEVEIEQRKKLKYKRDNK